MGRVCNSREGCNSGGGGVIVGRGCNSGDGVIVGGV